MHFLTAARGNDPDFADFRQEAERSETPVDNVDLGPKITKLSATLQARLVGLTKRQAFAAVASTQCNAPEAWRLLSHRYDLMTDGRFATLAIQVVGRKTPTIADIQSGLVQWEAQVLALERDHK